MTNNIKVLCYTFGVELYGANNERKQPGVCYVYHDERGELEGEELNPGNTAMSRDCMKGQRERGGRMNHSRSRELGRSS